MKGLHPNIVSGRRLAGYGIIGAEERVAISVRLLAGVSIYDVAMCFNVSKSTAYGILSAFIEVVSKERVKELTISFPHNDNVRLRAIAEKFSRTKSNHPALYGCVGALDGLAVRIRRPGVWEAKNPNDYSNRKGFFPVNV